MKNFWKIIGACILLVIYGFALGLDYNFKSMEIQEVQETENGYMITIMNNDFYYEKGE